ncbi:hypothetical protein [Moraxella pluranimalium]|uniref:Uncharacterized protein n=1 Tax=Moraxella pluranimalium TaxID=470453 RepID=A0A1T0CKP3_9GAMM|nr:hypothetical protein [Moraxella pluranimalium]OOS22928.1 hypothetical protein B0680_08925 [Moraxella pluranimalium]
MNALQQENYFLKSAVESAEFSLKTLSQLFAIIHNNTLESDELQALLWTMWTSTEKALEELKEHTGGEL